MALKRLIYVSKATDQNNPKDLVSMLGRAWTRNEALGLTGLLCYSEGFFLQILEGEPDALDGVYLRIAQDRRHTAIHLVSNDVVEERLFQRWSMGFVRVEDKHIVVPGVPDERPYGPFPIEAGAALDFLNTAGRRATVFGNVA